MAREQIFPTKCRYCAKNAAPADYKDVNVLHKFVSNQGKMYDRKRTGACAKHQRRLANAVKRARFLALIKYAGK